MVGERISGAGETREGPGGYRPYTRWHAGFSRARARRPSGVVARPADVAVVGERPRRGGGGRGGFLVGAGGSGGGPRLFGGGPGGGGPGARPPQAPGRV